MAPNSYHALGSNLMQPAPPEPALGVPSCGGACALPPSACHSSPMVPHTASVQPSMHTSTVQNIWMGGQECAVNVPPGHQILSSPGGVYYLVNVSNSLAVSLGSKPAVAAAPGTHVEVGSASYHQHCALPTPLGLAYTRRAARACARARARSCASARPSSPLPPPWPPTITPPPDSVLVCRCTPRAAASTPPPAWWICAAARGPASKDRRRPAGFP